MSKINIPTQLKKAGFDTAEAITNASMGDLLAVEGVGPKTVERLLKEIEGKPEPITLKDVDIVNGDKDEQARASKYFARRALVVKWYDGEQQIKCNLRVGSPLPKEVPQELIDELAGKNQVKIGKLTKAEYAEIHRVEPEKK